MSVSECRTFAKAITLLDSTYVKRVNEVFVRHRLNTSRQKAEEPLEEFFASLSQRALIAIMRL